MPTLVLQNVEKDQRWTVAVQEQMFVIGRSRNARVCIPDLSVSKNHVRIEWRAGRYRFRDLESTNGTLINEFRRKQGPLHDGDELRVGKFKITFYKDLIAPEQVPGGTLADQSPPPPGEAIEPSPVSPESAAAPAAPSGLDDVPAAGGSPSILSDETLFLDDGPSKARQDPAEAGAPEASLSPPSGEESTTYSPAAAPSGVPRRTGRRRESGPGDTPRIAVGAETPPSPLSDRLSTTWRWSTAALILTGVSCLLVGFLLGRMSVSPRSGSPQESDAPARSASVPRIPSPERNEEAAQIVATPRSEAPTKEVSSRADTLPPLLSDPPADLGDAITSRRALMRLFLDVLGRSPTRDEVRTFLPLSHDERWSKVQELAAAGPDTPVRDTVGDTFQRFLGRAARSAEQEYFVAKAPGDVGRLGLLLASTRLYASAEHRRRRSDVERARSLWVDLLDHVPTEENTRTVMNELDKLPEVEVVRTLVFSSRAEVIRSASGGDLEEWCREIYARILLRFPTANELAAAVAEVKASADGWKYVVKELALREEYKYY